MTTKASVVANMAPPRGRFPHIKRAGPLLFVSGISARRPDKSFAGAVADDMGNVVLDIREQVRAIIRDIESILNSEGAGLNDLVSMTCYLANMNDFKAFNETYGEFFSHEGPTRTTVAVHQLVHPHMLVELTATAYHPVEGTR